MTAGPVLPESERKIRIEATSPDLDAWVAANAGSGKTSILRNRVIRLLLDGVPPDRILCLTFTKAAAAEMQGRIFSALARWVTLDDDQLSGEIRDLTTTDPSGFALSPGELVLARTLFARAIEAPGGLKIQTIHAFAERILHLFPLEAGVPLDFTVLPEADSRAMRHGARQDAIEAALEIPASPLGRAFTEILAACGADAFAKAIDAAIDALSTLRIRDEAAPDAARRDAIYRAALGVPPGETLDRIEADFRTTVLGGETLDAAVEAIRAQKPLSDTQAKLADRFAAVGAATTRGAAWIEACLGLFLTEALQPRAAVFTKPVIRALPALEALEADAKAACLAYLERRRAFLTHVRSMALLAFAEFVLTRFERSKAASGALDFNDLIAALRRLLLSADTSWIMMKLDAAIDHVLIDEAQDTTREMWDIVRGLTSEFFAGEGRTRRFRSIFVVGDEKQSIFSFQGADPAVFEESRRYFGERSLRPGNILKPVALNYSFRSSADILLAVDSVFDTPERAEGLSASGVKAEHFAARPGFPGLVEIWPLERPPEDAREAQESQENQESQEDAAQSDATAKHASTRLAERIADQIALWIEDRTPHLVDGRPIEPGDILILVQRRNRFFTAMLKALKLRGIPVSGADRLKLQEELVIRDLLVIAEAALLDADDLALATALRTPCFGLDERELEALARGRGGSLRAALDQADDPKLASIAKRMRALSNAARSQPPFEFFSHLLTDPSPAFPGISGRKAFLNRLGMDANDPIDAFLLEALDFGRDHPASVALFVLAQRERDTELKRDLEHGGNRVRVMTVHGSKGLEARIVFLGDTATKPERAREKLAFLLQDEAGNHLLVWAGRKTDEAARLGVARGLERRKILGEYRRLLYVGMTRAADRLYVTGFAGQLPKNPEKSAKALQNDPMETPWHALVEAGLAACEGVIEVAASSPEEPSRVVRRLVSRTSSAPARPVAQAGQPEAAETPGWLSSPVVQEPHPLPPLRPSRAAFAGEGTNENGGESEGMSTDDEPRRRGIVLHQLYEWLPRVPQAQRQQTGLMLLRRIAPGLTSPEAEALARTVVGHIASPAGMGIFGVNSRPEVALAGTITLPDGTTRAIAGRIDRLVVTPERIDIVDLKTGRPRSAGSDPAISRQMALYRALMQSIYPKRAVRCAVFWTETGALDAFLPRDLDMALEQIMVLEKITSE